MILLFCTIACCTYTSYSQEKTKDELEQQKEIAEKENTYKGHTYEKVRTKFNKPLIELKRGRLVSNVLKVINSSKENLNFTVDILIPESWQNIMGNDKIYNVPVNDTIIVPILLVPSKLKTGNSEININCFLVDLDGQQIGDNTFSLKTKKKVSWDVVVKTANRFYFKNDEFNKKFEYNVVNKGNYKQDIYVNHKFPKKDLYLADTASTENKIENPSKTVTLDVGEEATFSYYASAVKLDKRNSRKVSITNYTPHTTDYFKKYGLVINSSEPKAFGQNVYKKSNKVAFIKLPNEIELQPYGYPSLPLTVDMNVQNILSEFPFMSLNLRGIKQLSQDENLAYSTELNYTQSTFSNRVFQDVPWYVGYYSDRMTLEVGQVAADIIGISSFGKGIRGSYRINDTHKVGAFYTASNGLFSPTNRSYGASHDLSFSKLLKITTKVGRNENLRSLSNTNTISVQPRISIGRKNNFGFTIAHSMLENPTIENRKGFLYSANYTTSSILRDLRSSFNARYNDKNFGGGNFERISFSHRSNYKINEDWSAYMTNSYQDINSTRLSSSNGLIGFNQTLLFNNLIFSKRNKLGSIQPGIFYDYRDFSNIEILSRGLSFRSSTYNYSNNFIGSVFLKAGYARDLKETETKDHFNAEISGLIRYKVWNFTTKYNYGFTSSNNLTSDTEQFLVPQLVRLSLQNQHVFKNTSLVLESNISYNYQNTNKNNSLGIYPELYYFSKKGWRYSLRVGYSYNSVDYSDIIRRNSDSNQPIDPNAGKNETNNLNIGFSLRKQFGLPIPFLKKNSSNIEFVSFLDVNGNGIKDIDETTIKNVVVKLGTEEVITSNSGIAKVNKAQNGKYSLDVFPLEELEGWFPNVNDSIFIGKDEKHYLPFVRGVKIYGDVILDRQKIAVTDEKPVDLSRIKITATKDNVFSTLTDDKGHFEFYLPNGKYILTMDESILSSNLRLSRNNIPIVLKNSQDGVYVSFYILEKRRKVIIRDFSKKKK